MASPTGNLSKYNVLFNLFALCLLTYSVTCSSDWLTHGGDIFNRRYADTEKAISPSTVSNLKLKWEFFAGRDITSTPSVYDGKVYFSDWNGHIYAVNADNGTLVWDKSLGELTGINGTGLISGVNVTMARTTPVIAGNLLIIGLYGPGVVIAVQRATGELVWLTYLNNHPASVVYTSGTVYKGAFYVGASSVEETLPADQCCTFRGSLSKLDVKTGSILWQTFTLPDNMGQRGAYAGGAIWGSSPAIDIKRNLVYVGTGYLYSAPSHVLECQQTENNQTAPRSNPNPCIEPENHANSILAFDINDGKIKWYRSLGGTYIWFFLCNNNPSTPGCPPVPNPDDDFGEAPMMLTVDVNGTKRDIAAVVQKSGYAWALDRDNGKTIWSTYAGPGGFAGGGTFGAATDGKRVYTNIANSESMNYTLEPSKNVVTGGAWVAMEASTGKIIWSTGNPTNFPTPGPVTIANNVLFGGSSDPLGAIYAMNAATGAILWSYNTSATVYGGMSVSDGCVYLGNGFRVGSGASVPYITAGTSLYAFCLD